MTLISIDPGVRKVALAVWDSETYQLQHAALVQHDYSPGTERGQVWNEMSYWARVEIERFCQVNPVLVMEVPQVYAQYDRKTDPNDLIDLAGVLGAIVGGLCGAVVAWSPSPKEWKGQAPKEITLQRVEAKLSPLEKSRIVWPSQKGLYHDVYDAIHLGIVHLEREGLRDFRK